MYYVEAEAVTPEEQCEHLTLINRALITSQLNEKIWCPICQQHIGTVKEIIHKPEFFPDYGAIWESENEQILE